MLMCFVEKSAVALTERQIYDLRNLESHPLTKTFTMSPLASLPHL